MAKEKVFIVLSHVHSLKKNPATGKSVKGDWEVAEKVEFVNQLRPRHHTSSSAIADYINKKMITGARAGMPDYIQFEQYIRKKYSKQLSELDLMYEKLQIQTDVIDKVPDFVDQFGNVREKTVFDI